MAVQMPGGRWRYYISAERFERWLQGQDLVGGMQVLRRPARDPALAAAVEAARDARPLEPRGGEAA